MSFPGSTSQNSGRRLTLDLKIGQSSTAQGNSAVSWPLQCVTEHVSRLRWEAVSNGREGTTRPRARGAANPPPPARPTPGSAAPAHAARGPERMACSRTASPPRLAGPLAEKRGPSGSVHRRRNRMEALGRSNECGRPAGRASREGRDITCRTWCFRPSGGAVIFASGCPRMPRFH